MLAKQSQRFSKNYSPGLGENVSTCPQEHIRKKFFDENYSSIYFVRFFSKNSRTNSNMFSFGISKNHSSTSMELFQFLDKREEGHFELAESREKANFLKETFFFRTSNHNGRKKQLSSQFVVQSTIFGSSFLSFVSGN